MRWLLLIALLAFLFATQINPWSPPAKSADERCTKSGVITRTLPDGTKVMTSSIFCKG